MPFQRDPLNQFAEDLGEFDESRRNNNHCSGSDSVSSGRFVGNKS
jgi:hypothetical protein